MLSYSLLKHKIFVLIRSIKLPERMILLFLLSNILPQLFLGIFFYLNYKNRFEENNYNIIQRNLGLYTMLINEKLNKYSEMADNLASSLTSIRMLSDVHLPAEKPSDYARINAYHSYLEQVSAGVKDLITVEVLDKTQVIAFYPFLVSSKMIENSPLNLNLNASSMRKSWSGAHVFENTEVVTIPPGVDSKFPLLLSVQVRSAYLGEPIGRINIFVQETVLSDILTQALSYENNTYSPFNLSTVFIIDDNDIVISHQEKNMLGKKLPESITQAFQASGKIRPVSVKQKDGQIIFFESSELTGFRVVSLIDADAFYAEIKTVKYFIIFFMTVSLVFMVLITVVYSLSILKPLQTVVKGIHQISDNNFDIQIEDTGKDEINFLIQHFNLMISRIKELIQYNIKIETAQKDAELRALTAQINPHFLYNTLDMINWMAYTKKNKNICDLINHLATFYRLSLNSGNYCYTIKQELENVKAYIAIQEQKFKEKIVYTFDVDEEAMQYSIPKLILQPLVENAIIHGIIPKKTKGVVQIHIKKRENKIILSVVDDGMGYSAVNKKSGHGLANVEERIELFFGKGYGLVISSETGKKTVVTIEIPAKNDCSGKGHENITA